MLHYLIGETVETMLSCDILISPLKTEVRYIEDIYPQYYGNFPQLYEDVHPADNHFHYTWNFLANNSLINSGKQNLSNFENILPNDARSMERSTMFRLNTFLQSPSNSECFSPVYCCLQKLPQKLVFRNHCLHNIR